MPRPLPEIDTFAANNGTPSAGERIKWVMGMTVTLNDRSATAAFWSRDAGAESV